MIRLYQQSAALLLLACAALPACADGNQPNEFRNLTVADGLSQSTVTAVIQDGSGFTWLGTQDGLNRYDGYGFRVFRNVPTDTQTLSESNITALYVDAAGTLWVGTKNGLNRYNPEREDFTRYINRDRNPVGIYGLADAEPGALWISSDEGLLHLDTHSGQLRTLLAWQASGHFALQFPLLRDRSGVVWVGLDHGLARIAPDGARLTPAFVQVLAHATITTLHETASGTLWIGTAAGDVYSIPADRSHIAAYPAVARLAHAPVMSIVDTANGTLWLGTETQGLLRGDGSGSQWQRLAAQPNQRNSLPSNLVTRLYVDHADRLWVAMRDDGAAILNVFATRFHSIGADESSHRALSSEVVHALSVDRSGRLWVGTENGLDRFSPDLKTVRYYGLNEAASGALTGHIIYALFQDHLGQMWVGLLNGGVCRYLPGTEHFQCYRHREGDGRSLSDNSVLAIAEDPQGFLWFGTLGGGLDRFDPQSGEFRAFRYDPKDPLSLNSNTVYSLSVDADGTVWVGTSGGLSELAPNSTGFVRINPENQQGQHVLNSAILDLQRIGSSVWMGTSAGLQSFDTRTRQLRSWTAADGLPSNYIDSILPDSHGLLWLGTNSGLVHFDPAKGVLATYQPDDGLPADEFNHHAVVQAPDGMLFLGTMEGVVSFRPEELRTAPHPLTVTLTGLSFYGKHVDIQPGMSDAELAKSISMTSALVLPYSHPAISLEFAALGAPDPAHLRYAFRLRGLDDNWITMEPGHHVVNFKPQSAGDLVFEVHALTGNGTPLGPTTQLYISVLPAPWLSTWAYVIYAALALCAGALLLRRFGHRMQRERRQNERVKLEESRLKLALRASEQVMWEADAHAMSIYCPGLMTLLGYEKVEQPVPRHAFMQVVHPEDRARVFRGDGGLETVKQETINVDFRARRVNDEYTWLNMRGAVVSRDDQGRPLTTIGTLKDISADKEQETLMLLAVHSLDYSSDAVVILDHDHRIAKINKVFEKMFGYSEDEVIGRAYSFLEGDSEKNPIFDAARGEHVSVAELPLRRKSDAIFPATVKVIVIHDHRSNRDHFLLVITDHSG